MNNPVLILYLEDSPRDAELVRDKLQQLAMPHELRIASNRTEYEVSLAQTRFDLIISDFSLPDYDGMAALALAREKQPDVPFILISGTLGEERAADCMLRGVNDYVLKQRLSRLVPAVIRTLTESETHVKRQKAEAALRVSEQRYRELFENSRDGSVVMDRDGKVVDTNHRFAEMLGYSLDEVLRLHIWDWDAQWPQAQLLDMIRSADIAGSFIETRHRRKDGSCYDVEINSNVVSIDGQDLIFCICRDVTARVQAEAALETSHQTLQRTLQELQSNQENMVQQARLSALGQLASGIAHDFNNALMPVLGYSDLLLSNPELLDNREKALVFIGAISSSAKDATKIVRRIRLIHQPDATEAFMPVDVAKVIRQSISLTTSHWEGELRAAGVHIRMETHLAAWVMVMGDESQLREALTNLILNAADAMPQGGVMTLSATMEAANVVLSITDTGIGMSKEVKAHCLEAFYTTKGAKGSGLGLAMVAGIVGRHKGRVEIDSTPGRGTTIRLRLPALTTAAPAATAKQAAPHTISSLRILLAEDEALVLNILALYLQTDGHTVEKARDGREALDKVSTCAFDLVITDRSMPAASGDEVARAVKARNPGTRVILLTGFGDMMHDAGECPPGVDLVLGKPLTPLDLQQAIGKVMTQDKVPNEANNLP